MANGFPFRSVQSAGLDIATMYRDGYQMTNGTFGISNATGALSSGFIVGNIQPPIGSNYYINTITLSCDLDATFWIEVLDGSLVANAAAASIIFVQAGPTHGAFSIPVNMMLMDGERITLTLKSSIPSGSGTNTFNLRFGITGRRITNDLAFEAPKTMLVVGDSITNTTGPNLGSEFYHSRIALELKSRGKHYRRIVKGDGGWSSVHALEYTLNGGLDVVDPDLITIMLGTNETVLADYQTNMTQIITYLHKRFPQSLMCVYGPPPRQGAAESTLVTMRSWAQSYVASLSNSNVIYTSLETAFDRTVDSNYVASDGAGGTRVHPTGASHGLMAQAVLDDWESRGLIALL